MISTKNAKITRGTASSLPYIASLFLSLSLFLPVLSRRRIHPFRRGPRPFLQRYLQGGTADITGNLLRNSDRQSSFWRCREHTDAKVSTESTSIALLPRSGSSLVFVSLIHPQFSLFLSLSLTHVYPLTLSLLLNFYYPSRALHTTWPLFSRPRVRARARARADSSPSDDLEDEGTRVSFAKMGQL